MLLGSFWRSVKKFQKIIYCRKPGPDPCERLKVTPQYVHTGLTSEELYLFLCEQT